MSQSLETITEADILAHVIHHAQNDFPHKIAHSMLHKPLSLEAIKARGRKILAECAVNQSR